MSTIIRTIRFRTVSKEDSTLRTINNPIKWDMREKIKATLLFATYNASTTQDNWKRQSNLLDLIYTARNLNHRGGVQTEDQKKSIAAIENQQNIFYFKFYGAFSEFVGGIIENLDLLKSGLNKLPYDVAISNYNTKSMEALDKIRNNLNA